MRNSNNYLLIISYKLQIDFLKKCLDKNPDDRWTCDQLLQHEYFKNFNFKMPEAEEGEFEKLKKLRNKSRVMHFEI